MTFCPNKSLPEWKALEESQPEKAYYLWNKYKGEVPSKYYFPKESDKREKAINYLSKLFPGKEVVYYDFAKQIGNKTQHGYVENGAINLWTSAQAGTEYHEAYHLLFRTMLSDEQRAYLYKDATKQFGAPTTAEIQKIQQEVQELYDIVIGEEEARNLVLEEKMADGFMEHMKTEEESSKGLMDRIAKWFRDLFSWIKGIISNKIGLRDIYSLMETTNSNTTFLGRGVFRNPQSMQSSYNPSMLVEGIPSRTVDVMVQGLTNMASKEIDQWDVPDMKKIIGDGKTTNGSIVNGLFYQIYEFKDPNALPKEKQIPILQKHLGLELSFERANIAYKNAVKQYNKTEKKSKELKDAVDKLKTDVNAAAKLLKDNVDKYGIKPKNIKRVKDDASERDKQKAIRLQRRRSQIIHVITNWYGKKDSVTDNTIVPSWRQMVINGLAANQYSVVKKKNTIRSSNEEGDAEEDQVEAQDAGVEDKDIKGRSHFADSPMTKLSQKAKRILRSIPIVEAYTEGNETLYRIKKNEVFTNQAEYYTLPAIYKQLSELWADTETFEEMEGKLIERAKYRQDFAAVNERIRMLGAEDRATLYKAFANVLSTFNLVILGEDAKILNANSSSTELKMAAQWRNQIVEVGGQEFDNTDVTDRAVYSKDFGETEDTYSFKIKEEKFKQIAKYFKKTYEHKERKFKDTAEANLAFMTSPDGKYSAAVVDLGSLIWELGMNLGSNVDRMDTIRNLQNLINKGFLVTKSEGKSKVTKPVIGKEAFDEIFNRGKLRDIFKTLAPSTIITRNGITVGAKNNKPTPYYEKEGSGLKFLASLAPFFTSRTAESFVTAVNTATYPLNMGTAIGELPTRLRNDLDKNKASGKALGVYRLDQFMFPEGMTPSHIFNNLLNNEEYVNKLEVKPLSAIRDNGGDGLEYEDFNSVDSILTRVQGFISNGDTKYFDCIIPAMADRAITETMTMPRINGHDNPNLNRTTQEVFRDAILQDLLRIRQAERIIGDPNAIKLPGIHTGEMTGISDEFMQFDGIDKLGNRIVVNKLISDSVGGRKMSELVENYIKAKKIERPLSSDLQRFERELTNMIRDLTLFYQESATYMAKLIEEADRKKDVDRKVYKRLKDSTDIDKSADESAFVQVMTPFLADFLVHEDLGRNEIIKLTRGNRANFPTLEDFTKRQRTLGTPGTKLAEKGTLGRNQNINPTWLDEPYGAISEYEELVFDDPMGEITKVLADEMDAWAERTAKQLVNSGYSEDETMFTNLYKAGEFEIYDGLTLISIDWLREIMQGEGDWRAYHELAYKNYKNDPEGNFLYPSGVELPKGAKAGEPIPIRPYKPFANEVKNVSGVVIADITKTAYFPLLKSYTKAFPIMDDMRMRMELNPNEQSPYNGQGLKKIHTASTISAKKGAKLNVVDLRNWRPGILLNAKSNTNRTADLRFPQAIPPAKEYSETILGRQVKKNAIANVKPTELYYYNAGLKSESSVSGKNMLSLYHAAIEERISRDMESVNKQIGLSQFREVVNKLKQETPKGKNVNIDAIQNAQEFKDAKKKLIKNIRNLIESQAIERELSDNFIKALDITIDKAGIARFSIPLDFPVYGTAFQTALLSIYNNNVFKQYVSGYEAVQTAALGGFEVNNALKFLEIVNHPGSRRGTRLAHAEIMVREDVLRKFGIEPGADLDANNIPEELRRIIGYRIPNQDKASTIIFKIKAVLPAGYEKAIVVPQQLVKLMGSDFDVDKMFLLFPELDAKGNKVIPNYNELWRNTNHANAVSKISDKELTNIVLDTMEAVMSSPEHYLETLRPLDDNILKKIRTSIVDLNPSLKPNPVFTGGMYETNSAIRNLLGNKMRGLWANALGGRNVASVSDDFNLKSDFAVKIVGETINTKFLQEIPKEAGYKYDSGLSTDKISSRYLNAAVDGTKAPYHYIVNDNPITFPVELLWIHYHGDTELLHHFLNQPIIRDFVDIMTDEFNGDLSKINVAYKKVADKYKILLGSQALPENYKKIPSTYEMSRQSIMSLTVPNERALQNFMKMYTAGKQLKEVFKLLTPDTMSGINRIEAIQSYVERRRKFDNPSKENLIDNAPIAFYGRSRDENVLTQFYDENSIYGYQRGYYNLLTDMLGVAGTVFPMTTSESVNKFKEAIKIGTGKEMLTTEQHRDINAAIIFTMLTRRDSPISVYFNQEYSDSLYKPGKGKFTLWTRTRNALSKYPALTGNEFLAKLSDDAASNEVKNFKTFNFDATQQFAPEEKSRIQDDLHNLLYKAEAYVPKPAKGASAEDIEKYKAKVQEIKQIGFDLCMHTLISNGFRKSAFNYAAMIPPQFWLNPMKRGDKLSDISVAEYLHEQSANMQSGNYFTNEDLIKFFRIFGEIRPGGTNLAERSTLPLTVTKLSPEHNISVEKFGGYPPPIMVIRTHNGKSGIYILSPSYRGGPTANYLSLYGATNNKKHIVGGDYLNIKIVGKDTPIEAVAPTFQGMYLAGVHNVTQSDVTQICML